MKKVIVGNWNHHIGSWPKQFESTSLNEKTLRMRVGFFIHGTNIIVVFSGGFHLAIIICKFQNVRIWCVFCTNLYWLMFLNCNTEFEFRWMGIFYLFSSSNTNYQYSSSYTGSQFGSFGSFGSDSQFSSSCIDSPFYSNFKFSSMGTI